MKILIWRCMSTATGRPTFIRCRITQNRTHERTQLREFIGNSVQAASAALLPVEARAVGLGRAVHETKEELRCGKHLLVVAIRYNSPEKEKQVAREHTDHIRADPAAHEQCEEHDDEGEVPGFDREAI